MTRTSISRLIVVDKFHIVRMGNQAVEDIRKTIRKGLDTKERRQLKNDRFILLKRQKDLNVSQQIILDSWTGNFPELRQAYELKESFYDIWDSSDAKEASERYDEWQKTIPSAMRSAFGDITSAYRNWNREINNYFTYRATNAYTESMNNLIRAVNRMGRGYSFKALRAKMLYNDKATKYEKDSFRMTMRQMLTSEMTSPYGEVNHLLGADISILVQLLEEGSL